MKTFVLACFLVASASAAFIPVQQQRHRRDVSELIEQPAYSYLPPDAKLSLPEVAAPETTTVVIVGDAAEVPTEAPSAALGNEGYEYRTVRRLKYRYRTRRDVSHLGQHYLPPSNEYLPPADSLENLENDNNSADTEEVIAAAPRVANEYLPPVDAAQDEEKEAAPSTEAALIVADETEAPLAAVREAVEETELEAAAAPIAEAAEVAEEDVPQDTAVLADDGYHYKQPVEEALLKSAAPGEYLPPLDDEQVVEAVGPAESAVLADDGYHYRAIKRLRF